MKIRYSWFRLCLMLLCVGSALAQDQFSELTKDGRKVITPTAPVEALKLNGLTPGQFVKVGPDGVLVGVASPVQTNGYVLASQHQSGVGGNGIANSIATLAGQCGTVFVEPTYLSAEEVPAILPRCVMVLDQRKGSQGVYVGSWPQNHHAKWDKTHDESRFSTLAGYAGDNQATANYANESSEWLYTGWNRGNPAPLSALSYGSGWFTSTHHFLSYYVAGAGIGNGIDLEYTKTGEGDSNFISAYGTTKGGAKDASGEMAVGLHLLMNETVPLVGTISSVGPQGSYLAVNCTSNCHNSLGVGSPVINLTRNVQNATGWSETSVSDDGIATIALEGLNISTASICNRSTSLIATPNQVVGEKTLMTFTLPTVTALVPGSHVTIAGTFIDDGTIASVGVFNGSQQSITIGLTFPQASGAMVCVGGSQGRWLEQTVYTTTAGGATYRYLADVIGAVDATHILVTSLWHGRLNPYSVHGGNLVHGPVKLYQGSIVTGVVNPSGAHPGTSDGGYVALDVNSAAWVAGDAIENPNFLVSGDTITSQLLNRVNPWQEEKGKLLNINRLGNVSGVVDYIEAPNDFTQLRNHGGTLYPFFGTEYAQGPMALAIKMDYAPEPGFNSGTGTPDGGYVLGVGPFAPCAGDQCPTKYDIWRDLPGGGRITFVPSTHDVEVEGGRWNWGVGMHFVKEVDSDGLMVLARGLQISGNPSQVIDMQGHSIVNLDAIAPQAATAPTGTCGNSPQGTLVLSQDGHASSCMAGAWVSRW